MSARITCYNQISFIAGTPQDWLRESGFSEFQPVKVLPSYPKWMTDTVPGISVLTLICLGIVTGATVLFITLKKQQMFCFKTK